jgi:serine/threonine protein kinase/Tfp pilus assembly protein PilF
MSRSDEPSQPSSEALTKGLTESGEATAWQPRAKQGISTWQFPGNRYRIVGEIGRGGMGLVVRAYDESFGRLLAIKLLLPRHGAIASDERRLLEEARITGQLQHPGIPPVHEVGRLVDGRPFFSMKLIEGRNLAEIVAERATPHTDLPRFVKIFEQVAQTLAYAHAQGVIHRDLKPSNVMVGSFGEVQVMDWGLAKRLRGGETPAIRPPQAVAGIETVVLPEERESDAAAEVLGPSPKEPVTTLVATPKPDSDPLTEAGQVMGTPAFMCPEQARGEIQSLDERADVFGLGAILCVLLTGAPPYHGTERTSVFRRAASGDLTDAFQRLHICGADGELIELCQACLTAEVAQRPAHAGLVAERISAYLASVQERLEETRVERAAAEVKAREERKRRRLAVGLALAVVLLVAGGAGVGFWRTRDQARRDAEAAVRAGYLEREVTAALAEAEHARNDLLGRLRDERQAAQLLSDPKEWERLLESAQEACKRAEVLAGGDRDMLSPELGRRLTFVTGELEKDERDRRLAFELDRIRLESLGLVGGMVRLSTAAPRLASLFRDAGYDIEHGVSSEVGALIHNSPTRLPLVAGLDFWALAVDDRDLQTRLLEITRAADPDPWRDRFRQADVWHDPSQIKKLIGDVDCARQSPQLLAALGQNYYFKGGDASGLFRRALIHYPRDFWLSFGLGLCSKKPAEQAGAFRAALAVRPEAVVAYYNLGVVQQGEQILDEALASYQNALALDPKNGSSLNNLGVVLEKLHRPAEAIACYRKAIAAVPNNDGAYLNLGSALQVQGNFSEAIICYRKALEIDPRNSAGYNNLGTLLRGQERLDEAIASFQKAVEIEPNNAVAWCNLGHALRQQNRYKEALPAFRRGHEIGSHQSDWPYSSAFWILETQQWIALDEKLAALSSGKAPAVGAREQLTLAEFCATVKSLYARSADFYASAFTADPKLAADTPSRHRYNAACVAARAADGQGQDGPNLDQAQRTRRRNLALHWLTSELKAWTARLEREHVATDVARTLRRWQEDSALASVRDEKALAKLPTAEQSAWNEFWARVATLRARAEKPSQPST